MNHLFSMALLLLMLAPQKDNLPDAFHKLPEQDKAKATVVVTGIYGEGRSPCLFMPDGTRRWALESYFRVTKVYRGPVGGKSIYISGSVLPKREVAGVKLEVGSEYLVLLQPSEESMKTIKAGEYVPAWAARGDEGIIAIVKLK